MLKYKKGEKCMKKKIALIAHDSKKLEMVEWSLKNKAVLEKYELCGTGTTSPRHRYFCW